jgi:hypothetical protein
VRDDHRANLNGGGEFVQPTAVITSENVHLLKLCLVYIMKTNPFIVIRNGRKGARERKGRKNCKELNYTVAHKFRTGPSKEGYR